jgi:hypothetical protein
MKKENSNKGKNIKTGSYESMGVDDLLIYSVRQILENDEECTLERLVYECFTLFPNKFGLSRYPEWPDSTRVYRSWRRCLITRGWLSGSPQEGFTITSKGEQAAKSVANKINRPIMNNKNKRDTSKVRGKEEAVMRYVRKSDAFKKWLSNKSTFAISESELSSVLNVTLETPKKILRENFEYYKENARFVNDTEVLSFLESLEKGHRKYLGG